MLIQCRPDDKTPHIVVWKSLKAGSMFVMEEKEKEFPNFMDASGFASGLSKRGIRVEAIIPFRHIPFKSE